MADDSLRTPYVPGDERNVPPNQNFAYDTTYHPEGVIRAEDFNLLASEINEVIGDSNQGNSSVLEGGFGYGSPVTIPIKQTDEIIRAAEWTSLLVAIDRVVQHQGTVSEMPDIVNVGDYVISYDDAQQGMIAVMEYVRANRFELSPAKSLTTVGGTMLTESRTRPWTDQINLEFEFAFNNFDEMRHYFNTGSKILFEFEKSGGTPDGTVYYDTPYEQNYFYTHEYNAIWQERLEDIGRIVISADRVYRELGDSFGTITLGSGFYGIMSGGVTAWREIYRVVGDYDNGQDVVRVYARLNTIPASAHTIQFKVEFISEPGETYSDGLLTVYVDHTTSVDSNAPSPSPTVNLMTALDEAEPDVITPP